MLLSYVYVYLLAKTVLTEIRRSLIETIDDLRRHGLYNYVYKKERELILH